MALEYEKVVRDGKPSEALVFHCSDPDFRRVFNKAIEVMNLGKLDPYVRPGPSKTLIEDPSALKEIKKLYSLHDFGRLVLMDHINCGGFGIEDESEEATSHFDYFRQNRELLERELPGVQFEPHLYGWDKEIIEGSTD